jgi:hypothetical protein
MDPDALEPRLVARSLDRALHVLPRFFRRGVHEDAVGVEQPRLLAERRQHAVGQLDHARLVGFVSSASSRTAPVRRSSCDQRRFRTSLFRIPMSNATSRTGRSHASAARWKRWNASSSRTTQRTFGTRRSFTRAMGFSWSLPQEAAKNVKEELQNCLKLRNACGHPSSLKVGASRVAAHIEILIQNVFAQFS